MLLFYVAVLSCALTADRIETDGENVSVKIVPLFGRVPIRDMFTKKIQLTQKKYLCCGVTVTNKSDEKKIDFRGWGSNMFMAFAFLKDDLGNQYKMVDLGVTNEFPGKIKSESIYPGKAVLEVLVFEIPIDKASSFSLILKGGNVGEEGDLVVKFPRTAIKDKEKEEGEKAAEIEKANAQVNAQIEEHRRRQDAEQAADLQRRKEALEKARWRVWTSADGKFQIEAKFVRAGRGKVVLEKKDGKEIELAEEKLSEENIRWIKTGKWKAP